MLKFLTSVSLVALGAGATYAGGIDRSGQGVSQIFEKGTYAELSFGALNPSVSGTDVAIFGGGSTGNVASNYTQFSLAYKQDINDKLSFAIILDQPFGAKLLYGTGSVALGGTSVDAKATSLTGVMRYKLDQNFSVLGGVRADQASGNITLKGAAYGAFNGYNVSLAQDTAVGYVVGIAYEKPEIAMRIALTYNSAIKHNFDTVETIGPAIIGIAPTEVSTPQSVNLDFQTGIAADTLLFGQIRWAQWSAFDIDPQTFTTLLNGGHFVKGGGLIALADTTTYTIGVGRKFNDTWSGAVSVLYEAKGDPLVSPLAPTNGKVGVTLAAVYTQDNMKVTAGINYTRLGDAQAQTARTARTDMTGNSVVGVGVKVGFNF